MYGCHFVLFGGTFILRSNLSTPPPGHMLQYKTLSRGNCTPDHKLACFALYLKIVNTFLKNNVYILKQIVQKTKKWQWNFSRPIDSKVMDQNSQNIVLINSSRTTRPTQILMLFLSSLDKLL